MILVASIAAFVAGAVATVYASMQFFGSGATTLQLELQGRPTAPAGVMLLKGWAFLIVGIVLIVMALK
jgi:hypothetical protein